MMILIRAMLVVALGANVLCTDAWMDDPGAVTAAHARSGPPEVPVEPIWNTPA